MRRHITAVLVFPGCMLAGCAVGPDYRAPQPELPEVWHQAATDGLTQGNTDVQEWWQVFEDPRLSELIERAAEGNLDLRLAVLRIREARALRGVAAGELLPTLGGQGSYQRYKRSANSQFAFPRAGSKGETFANTVTRGIATNALGTGLGTIAPGIPGVTNSVAGALVGLLPTPSAAPETDEINLHAAGFDASWEIDVFGGIRRGVQSADAALEATVEDYRGTLVTLLAEVATTYVEIRTLQSQIEATSKNITLQQETLDLTQARLDLDLATELDVQQAETNLATTQAQLPQLESALAISIYRLSVLIGREPSALWDELAVTAPIPQTPAEVFVGVPTDLLRQRPDIRSAERHLAAQTARIGVAAAELYPRFTLSGTFGFEALNFKHAIDRGSITYGFGPSVRWNIFDGLRNLNRIAAQEAATHQSYVVYQRTLLTALQEVESSLVAYKREQVRRDALDRAVKAADRSVQLAETLYRNGFVDFQNVLDAQRSLANLENTLAQSRGLVTINLVSLYKALGGGWSPEVAPQQQYLEQRHDVLHRPVGFFLSGGKSSLPWDRDSELSDEQSEPSDDFAAEPGEGNLD
ncbi:MAG: efflux transporter outer membrane subunit [Phycisphaerales bacterium]|nr:efflux transporter outer membrane subunit [Phycisphaerales bacterium]